MLINTEHQRIPTQACEHGGTRLHPIETLAQLHFALQKAIELEFSTIPTYLSALYTIEESTNTAASTIIRSVVIEEMLHLTNAANVLIATGGSPALNNEQFIPNFPTPVPDGEDWFVVNLLKFSPEALQTFMYIEEPGQDAHGRITIGDFYENIQQGLERLAGELGPKLFPANTVQVPARYYYGGGGQVIEVTDLDSAMLAINEIVAQGEGIPLGSWNRDAPFPDRRTGLGSGDHQLFMQTPELAHYYRFAELHEGRYYVAGDSPSSGPSGPEIPIDYGKVYNMRPNPKASDYAHAPELAAFSRRFNSIFSELLDELHLAFNGEPKRLEAAVGEMFKLKYAARELMRCPIPGSEPVEYAGPTWDYLPPSERSA